MTGEPEGLGWGSAGSGRIGETDGRGLREVVGPVVERATDAVLGAQLGEWLLRGALDGEQLGGFVFGDAADGPLGRDLRPENSYAADQSGIIKRR